MLLPREVTPATAQQQQAGANSSAVGRRRRSSSPFPGARPGQDGPQIDREGSGARCARPAPCVSLSWLRRRAAQHGEERNETELTRLTLSVTPKLAPALYEEPETGDKKTKQSNLVVNGQLNAFFIWKRE